MPSKEIKELRQAGQLEEALAMAQAELEADPDNIWAKRNISWVYYEYLKQNESLAQIDEFISWLDKIKLLEMPEDEKLLFDQLCWQIGKMLFVLSRENHVDFSKVLQLFEITKNFHFTKPAEAYSFLFKAFHKSFKDSDKYIDFADWWGFENFMPADFQKEKLPNGNEIMAIAEQGYIAYAKHLLPLHTQMGEVIFDKEKALVFLPVIEKLTEDHPHFQYPAYFHAKLLLALGEKDDMLTALLPFARKKRNDFWVWDILSQAFPDDKDKQFACYCRALLCNAKEEMLVGLRQRMASQFISRKLYNEAKTEMELVITTKTALGHSIPSLISNTMLLPVLVEAVTQKSNVEFYKQYADEAEAILFSDTPEETVIVEFVNKDKQMLNFYASETKFGFFKYGRLLKDVRIGDTLKVRFQEGTVDGRYLVYTAKRIIDNEFRKQFVKDIEGQVKIGEGKAFGFLNDIYIHPSIVTKLKLKNGVQFKGKAMKSFNKEKKLWSWKLIEGY